MKILFVWPRPLDPIAGKQKRNKALFQLILERSFIYPKPITFPILAAITPQKHEVELVEGRPCDINYEKDYDIIGITSSTRYVNLAYEIADEFRKRGKTVILGGWHVSALPDEAKQHVDSVVIGEAEDIWPQLLKDLENGKLKPFYRPAKPVDPENIPHPKNIYKDVEQPFGVNATRGCPVGCKFCSITNMEHRNKFRMRPIVDVIEDIKSHTKKRFAFMDNSMTINPTYTKELFKAMKGINKRFSAQGNINVLGTDDELLKLANEAGCSTWAIGFESVTQESIDDIGKKTNKVKEYSHAIKKIHDHGMVIIGNFILGFDNDKLDVFEKTYEFINGSEIDIPLFFILTPFPGTPIYHKLEKEGRILTKDWSQYYFENVVFKPKHMTPEELLENTQDLYKKCYKLSDVIRRTLVSSKFGFNSLMGTFVNNFYVRKRS